MSILIEMEMPMHCMDCPFMVSRDNDDCILQSAEANERFENWEQMRAECPLIEIPPHGRLIDADAFIKRISELVRKAETDGFGLGADWYKAFIRHIELAPTIIQADKED